MIVFKAASVNAESSCGECVGALSIGGQLEEMMKERGDQMFVQGVDITPNAGSIHSPHKIDIR